MGFTKLSTGKRKKIYEIVYTLRQNYELFQIFKQKKKLIMYLIADYIIKFYADVILKL